MCLLRQIDAAKLAMMSPLAKLELLERHLLALQQQRDELMAVVERSIVLLETGGNTMALQSLRQARAKAAEGDR